MQRCIDAEHMTEFRTLGEVQEYVGGKPFLNRLALQVKTNADGPLKLRLITDLLPSQRNWFLRAPERIVLPRLVDAVESASELLEASADPAVADRDQRTALHWGRTARPRAASSCCSRRR